MMITQNTRQKGFTVDDGCKQNTLIFSEAIALMKRSEGGIITIADISKAFDTVSHEMIGGGLRRKGVPEHLVRLIENMYVGCSTHVPKNGSVELLRGAKQGDPLSPLLFNLAVEPILDQLTLETPGVRVGPDDHLAVLAFADDMIMIGKDRSEAQKQLDLLDGYLMSLEMSLSADKCATFEIKPKNRPGQLRTLTCKCKG